MLEPANPVNEERHSMAYASPSTRLCCALLAAAALAGAPALSNAGESPFGYVYTTDTHGKGSWEFEQWATQRRGQANGSYSAWQYRSELEYGVTDNLQTSVYANYGSVSALHNRPDNTTGPGAFIPDNVNPDARYSNRYFESFSNEWIYRVLSPYKDALGVALYIEPTVGPRRRELEGRLILQKNFLGDRLIWAANLTAAQEKERFHGDWEKESELELTTGLAYAVAQGWQAGAEYLRHTGYEGYGFSRAKRAYTANFIGPSIHYASRSWWLTGSFLTQMRNARAYNDEAAADIIDGRMYGEHHERHELRLRVGIAF
jgi:hypothetical protein